MTKQNECIATGEAAENIYRLVRIEKKSPNEVLDLPIPAGKAHETAILVERALSWKGTWVQFVHTVYKECMK